MREAAVERREAQLQQQPVDYVRIDWRMERYSDCRMVLAALVGAEKRWQAPTDGVEVVVAAVTPAEQAVDQEAGVEVLATGRNETQ